MKLKPLDDRVVVKVEETGEEVSAGGIIIPDTAKEKPRTGTVIAVGTDEDLKELVKEGDTVLFAKYGGEELTMNGDEIRIISRSDILAIVE
ncbi:MAG: co-chaperone GroES [Chlorobi bacterium]|nr:co-chaperone GroES [Chlorobiota bacterium]